MQLPISAGAVLQNRYRLLSLLGQGGFGRTYLAEDQGRFNERCALKEFIPIQSGAYALEKSKELFQREAATLYQIQHPQIPQFRATFEENERLFLVQDYVEGKTYRDLLNERKLQGLTFSEGEALQLIRQLLPVLAHIHSKGIIHRDITPDNIMLRYKDNLPVLIDFGVVKEIVTRFQLPTTMLQQTTVGKPGYAPSEQMQSGRAYPNSDLYSLAVSVVVLLTGREPQELYDDMNLTWHWERHANVSPGFAQVINRMLSYRPGDRYQSVREVAQALEGTPSQTAPTQAVPITPPRNPTMQAVPPTPGISEMQTMAVGRRPLPTAVNTQAVGGTQRRRSGPVIQQPQGSIWDNPLAVIGVCLGLAILTGIGSWAVVSAILNTNSPSPVASVSPTATESAATPSPSPTPDRPVEYRQRLNLTPGETTTAEGTLKANEAITYTLSAQEGERLTTSLSDEGVLLTVLGPDGEPLDEVAQRVTQWNGQLERSGDYQVRLSPVRDVPQGNYRLTIGLEPAEEEPAPEPSEEPSPSPTPTETPPQVETQQVQFAPGSESAFVSDRIAPNLIRRYLVNAQAGQVMMVSKEQGDIRFDVFYPDGSPVENAQGLTLWESELSESGDFQVEVRSRDTSDFTIEIAVTGNPF